MSGLPIVQGIMHESAGGVATRDVNGWVAGGVAKGDLGVAEARENWGGVLKFVELAGFHEINGAILLDEIRQDIGK